MTDVSVMFESPYKDEHGLLTQKNGNGGDTTHKHALYVCALSLLGAPELAKMEWLHMYGMCCIDGNPRVWVRHPTQEPWNDPKIFSRDQRSRVDLASMMIGYDPGPIVWRHQNGDLIGVGELRNRLRFKASGLLDSVKLTLLDIDFLFGLLFRKFQNWDYDCLMFPDLAWAQYKNPTFISKFTWSFYKNSDYRSRIHKYFHNDVEIDNTGLGQALQVAATLIERKYPGG